MQEVLVIAGEKSAEEHFVSMYGDIISSNSEIHFYGVGGNEMKSLGIDCIYDLSSFSSMGLTEPIKKLPYYFSAMNTLIEETKKRRTKFAILIDFQEFNLKMAQRLTENGIKVLYYVAPQAWAWRSGRCKKLAKYTYRLFTILPFEKKWFSDRGVKQIVECQHPVFKKFNENIPDFEKMKMSREKDPVILFLPGSRNSEVKKLLPVYYKALKKIKILLPHFKFSIVLSDSITLPLEIEKIREFNYVYSNAQLDLALEQSSFCISASGTVNLNCAFYRVPTIVCYDANRLNYFVARELVGYKGFASLVNIISEKEVFPELLQDKCNATNLATYVLNLVNSQNKSQETLADLEKLFLSFAKGESKPGKIIREVIENES